MLGEGASAPRKQDLLQHAGLELDQHCRRPWRQRVLPVIEQRIGIVAELDADLGQNAVRCGFHLQQVFFR